MLSEDKFFEKAQKFALYPTVNNDYFTFDELKDKISKTQTDKDGNLVILYASNTLMNNIHMLSQLKLKVMKFFY